MLPLLIPPFLLSLTLHEFAHARVALMFGDPTALRAGRVTLNPLKHLDPVGSIMILMVGFGWAKPVPVNPFNLRPRKLGDIMVSLAGPLTNLALAIIAGLVLRIFFKFSGGIAEGIASLIKDMLLLTLGVNVMLCVLNLIPLYPLDGHHVLRELLPPEKQSSYMFWQRRFGFFVLIALIMGPRLLGRMTKQQVPDPIGWLLDHTMNLAIGIFL